jgi:hypothetical protein
MVDTVIFLTTTGAGSWTVPDDWNSAANTIEVIGGGGGGAGQTDFAGGVSCYGGNGGDYAKVSNVTLTPAASVPYAVGAGGAGGVGLGSGGTGTSGNGTAGGNTFFGNASYGSATVAAKGGQVGTANSYTAAVAQDAATNGIGTTKYSGGQGGAPTGAFEYTSGGGGGAAGPSGAGGNGTKSGSPGGNGGTANNGGVSGGAGTTDANGTAGTAGAIWTATAGGTAGPGSGGGAAGGVTVHSGGAGGLYGGGGGGACQGAGAGAGGAGKQGIIVITYTPSTPTPTPSASVRRGGMGLGLRGLSLSGGYVGGATGMSPAPSPSSTQYFNGDKPATHAWDVQTKGELLDAINSTITNGVLNKKIYLRGKSTGNNYCVNSGSGRRFDFPSGIPAGMELIAADHDDLPLFAGGEAYNYNSGFGSYTNGWINLNSQPITMDGFEVYDDETPSNGDLYRFIFQNRGPGSIFRRYFAHGTLNGVKPHQIKLFQQLADGGSLTLEYGICAELMGMLMVKNGAVDILTRFNSAIRCGEHPWKSESTFTNWHNYQNLCDGFIPGYNVGTGAYDDHANMAYLGAFAGGTLSDFTMDDYLFISEVDHEIGQVIRVEPKDPVSSVVATSNSIKLRDGRWWGKSYIAFDSVQGTGNEISGNTGRGISDGAFSEAGTAYIRADNSQFASFGNDAKWTDDGGNTRTLGGGAANVNEALGVAVTMDEARTAFEAAALLRKQQTRVTLGI